MPNHIGRILIGLVFTYMGIYKILNWTATADWIAMKGLPLVPLLLVGAIVIEILGGTLLILNIRTKLVSGLLALFLIPTNIIFHNFWAMPPEQAASEFLSFLQNIAIIGGLLNLEKRSKVEIAKVVNYKKGIGL